MATLTIQNVPDELHRKLKENARQHRRSTNDEAIVCLEQVLAPSTRLSAADMIAKAEHLNEHLDGPLPDIVREAKQEGRA